MQRFIVVIICLLIMTPCAAAQTVVNISDLIANSRSYDQKVITIEGEAIGDLLDSQESFWVNVLQEGTAIGVWADDHMGEQIKFLGDYGHEGDILRIVGTYNHSCSVHGGDIDIHADSINVTAYGNAIRRPISGWELAITLALSLTGAVLFVLDLRRRRQKEHIKERPF